MFFCCANDAPHANDAFEANELEVPPLKDLVSVPAKMAPGETAPAETAPAEMGRAETAAAETAPVETAPTEMGLAETAPAETAPAEMGRAETAAAETAPVETAPTEMGLAETAPAETAPVETAPAETTAPTAAEPRKPDFAGTWECEKLENLEEFLTVTGVGFLVRKAAVSMLSKFTLKTEFQVEGDGERFKNINTTPKGVNSLEFTTNGVEFSAKFGAEQTPGIGKSVWDGDTLVLTINQPGLVIVVSRTLIEGKMIERHKATKGGKEATMIRTWMKVS
eukprot:TRINITY_DN3800_c0_g1_i1.p1 TRINITY_DN3800_c0_g1~~TRINITY_DN3800_c0_g1_i1.p1  ORF type:complete len:280 (-),score=63.13 TRINITY_DN3800_c0_g1_i1:147-986(-)